MASLRRYRQWQGYWRRRGLEPYPTLAAVVQHCGRLVQQALGIDSACPLPAAVPSQVVEAWRSRDLAAIILLASRANRSDRWLCWQYLRFWRQTKPLLGGHDLAALGYPRGRLYSEILSSLLAAQLDQRLELTPEAARQWVQCHFPLRDGEGLIGDEFIT